MAKIAETAIGTTAAQGDMSTIMDEIRASRAEVRQLTNRVDKMSVGSVSQRSPTPESHAARHSYLIVGRRYAMTLSEDKPTVVRSVGDPSERRRRDHSPMDLLATDVVGHTTANVRQLTLTAITVVEECTRVLVAVERAVADANVFLHRIRRPSITWAC